MKYLIIFIFTFLFSYEIVDGVIIYNYPDINTSKISSEEIKTIKPSLDIAVLIDKKLFKDYLSSLINSLNSYLLYKNVDYNLTIYDINQTQQALNHKNIIFYTFDTTQLNQLVKFKNNFYLPMLNKKDINITQNNFYFGGIDFEDQIQKLSTLIPSNNIIAINDNTLTSLKLSIIESNFFNVDQFSYNDIKYYRLNHSYIFLNTSPNKSAKIISDIYYKNIKPYLILSTQINYTPILISLNQLEALKNIIIANSILTLPKELIDINMLLKTDIQFNWVNYSSSLLLNKIYNQKLDNDYYLNDFRIYMFNNQINYKTQLFQILFGGFRKIIN